VFNLSFHQTKAVCHAPCWRTARAKPSLRVKPTFGLKTEKEFQMRRTSCFVTILPALAAFLFVAGCEKSEEHSGATRENQPSQQTTRVEQRPSSPADLVPIFDQDHALATDQTIKVSGYFEYFTAEASPLMSTEEPYARVRVGGGDFQVVLDETAQRMAREVNMKPVYVEGHLTGNSFNVLSIGSMTSPVSGVSTGPRRVPELLVEKYEKTTLDSVTTKFLDDMQLEQLSYAARTGDLETVQYWITARPELVNMKQDPSHRSLTWVARANGHKEVADFLGKHGGR